MCHIRYNRHVGAAVFSAVSLASRASNAAKRAQAWVSIAVTWARPLIVAILVWARERLAARASRAVTTAGGILLYTKLWLADVASRVRHLPYLAAEAGTRAAALVSDVVPRARLYALVGVTHWRMMMDDGTLARPIADEAGAADGADDVQPPSVGGGGDQSATLPSPFVMWLRLVRPSALLLVLVPALTALILLWLRGASIRPIPALAGVVSLVLAQAGASLLDVYLEYARRAHLPASERNDRMTARALLASSKIHPMNVMRLGILLLMAGALAGIPLITTGGWPVALLGAAGLLIAFLFSATSFALKRFALSDLLIGLALGPGIVAGMMLAQRHIPTGRDMLFACALGLLAMVPAEGAHLRDVRHDTLLHRKTLVTVLGDGVGRAVYVLYLLAGMALLALAALPKGAPHGALLALFALPSFAIPVSGALRANPGFAREHVVLQELRAYAVFAFWLLLGLAVNAILIRGLGPLPATV